MPKKVYSKRLNANLTIPDDWGPEQIAAAEERLLAQEAPSAPTEEKSVPLGGVGAFFQGIGRGVANTVIGIPEGIGGVTGSETIQNIGRGMRESDLGRLLTEPPPESIAQYPKLSQAGELTGNVLTYLTPGAVLKAPRVAMTALAMTQGAAEQAREADRMGATPGERQLASILGAATGTLDAVVPNRMTAGLRGLNAANAAANQGIAGVLRRGAGTAVLGGLTEGSQQLAQNKIEQSVYNPNQDTWEGVPESVGIGAGVEGLLDVGLQALAGRAGRSVMGKRSRMGASPEVSRTDRNAVGVRSGEGGDPIVEYLARMNPEFVPMTPEQRSQNFAERMQRGASTQAPFEAPLDVDYETVRSAYGLPPRPKPDSDFLRRMQRMASSAPEAPIDVDVSDAQMRAAYGLPPRAAKPDPYTFTGASREEAPAPRPTGRVKQVAVQPAEDLLNGIPTEVPQPAITDLAGITSGTPVDIGNLTSTTDTPEYAPIGRQRQAPTQPMRPDAMTMPAPVSEGGTAAVDASIPFTSPLPQKLSMAAPQPTAPQYTIAGMREELNAGKTPELAMDVHRALKGLGVDDLFSTRLVDNMANPVADGQTSGRIIELALLSKDKDAILRTLDHEAVHAMKTMGLFTDMEWSILERAFDPKAILDEQERKFYTDYYKNDMAVKEEAIARGMEKYGRGKIQLAPEIQAVVDRKLTALDRIGNVFRDQQVETPKQVMDRFASGEIGARNVDIQNVNQPRTVEEPRPTQDPTANRSTELEDYDTEAKDGSGAEEGEVGKLSVKQLPVPNSPYAPHDDRTKLRKAADSVFGGKFGELMDVARQQMIDMRLGIEESAKKAGFTKTEQSAGFITRQMDRAPELAAATSKYGPLQYIGSIGDGHFEVADSPDLAWGKVMKEAHDKGKLDQLRHYLTGERAAALKTQDRENKLTPQQIQQFRDYGKDPEIKAWAERWRKFNDGMIDTLQKSGRIDKDLAAKFKENIYVPFYRVAESDGGDVTFGGSGSSMASAPRIAKLKGGKADLNDFVENIVHNTTMLTQMATKNVAMQRVIRDGLVNGTVVPTHKGEAGKTVKVYINGKEKHFEVKDKLLMRSLTSSLLPFNVAVKFGAIPARILRSMVTHAPVFAIRNAMRDSATAWAMGYTNVPYTNIASGIRDAVNQAPNFQKLERMGVLGTGIRGEGGDTGTASNIYKDIQGKHNWWDSLSDITSKSEAVSRLTIYDAVKKRGGSDAEAAYQAQEFLNFQRRGGNQIMQIFNALVPFQNARIQGADVFYRGARGQGPMPVKLQRTIAMRAAYLTALGGMYAALMHDDESYKNASPDVRDQNFLIPLGNGELFKVPIPFEIGVFKIIGEHTANMMNGTSDGKDFMKAMKSYLSDTLHLDFIPQAIKPMVETTTNYDNFRQRQVEPEYMKRTEPGLRSDADTSELAKGLGKYLDWSPMKIDHWIKGYTGTIGMYTNSLISHLVNENPNELFDDLFAGKAHDMPLVGAMFQGPNGPRNLIDFYEINSISEQAANAIKAGAERTDKRLKLAAAERRLQPIETQIRELTSQEKKIRANKALKRAQKIAALEELRRRKILLAAPAQQVKRSVQ